VQIQDLRERRRAEREREELVREQTARTVAERTARRLEAVQRLADTALGAQSVHGLVRELLTRVGEVLAADAAAVVLARSGDEPATVHRIDGTVAASLTSAAWDVPEAGAVADVVTRAVAVRRDDAGARAAGAHPLGDAIRSLLAVPLRAEGEVVGALLVGSLFPRMFDGEDVSILTLAADRTGLAVQRLRRYEEEHAIATRLQRSLSPSTLPRVPGITTAARYQPAGVAAAEVGGDWYDAVGLPTGDLLLVMGDVAGRGVEAAAMMGQLRSAIRAYALHEASPAVLLERLNAFQLSIADDTMATVLLARISLDGTLVTTASAGHPPALLTAPDGQSSWLTGGRGVPLGALDDPGYREARHDVEPGSTLVLYTDGLVESRGEDLQQGLSRLAASVLEGPGDLEALCDHVLARAEREPGSDDVSLLVLRTVGAAEDRFTLEVAGDAPALAALRVTLRRWLASSDADEAEVSDITMAVNEAVQNAIEHGHSFRARPVEVRLSREDGVIEAVVRDGGRWRPSGATDRGRGILLMRALVDDVRIDRRADGTVVRLRRRLRVAAGTPAAVTRA
jgi:serine phosphatase RsbU (regulator of sigma subunit)/anti-sigma regulatory factor (Ser/Thr protein kinase)